MYGSFIGNLTAVFYLICFQLCGIILSDCLFHKEKKIIRLLIGSVAGSFLLMWLPVITAFVFGFNVVSHLAALIILIAIVFFTYFLVSKKRRVAFLFNKSDNDVSVIDVLKNNCVFVIIFVILSVFYALLLNNHVLLPQEDGMYCGQCTYGDMNMHLGFITSIAKQGVFPPDYSIMPGERLCYPFLCDSISSSLYVFGSSLKLSYCLPMMLAFLQVLGGFYAFAGQWLKNKSKAVVAFVLFFLNGGLGFLYFINVWGEGGHTIGEIFTEFYHTPTNFVDYNVRWVNVIADMLLPQRATLFGWSMLFTILYILWRAHFENKKKYFYWAGVLAGGLVMIHTHSFLALGIVCAVWLLFDMIDKAEIKCPTSESMSPYIRAILLAVSLAIMSFFRVYDLKKDPDTDLWFAIGIVGLGIFVLVIVYLAIKLIKNKRAVEIFNTWCLFLAVVLPLALIQLFTWTFNQATGDNFVRGQFNWANIDDQYIMFYFKNIGLIMLFIMVMLIVAKKKDFRLAMCGIGIWFIAEFLGFQPNSYDNNKLLYVGYIFLLIPTASLLVDLYKKIKLRVLSVMLAVVVMLVCTISGILTLGREYVSEYQLYGKDYLEITDYINESDIPVDAVILTHNNHNNAVSSLTGRNIVVGTSTFLYYHGFDISVRHSDINAMFTYPEENRHLFDKYGVEYIVIGSHERANYDIDFEWFNKNCGIVLDNGYTSLLKLK